MKKIYNFLAAFTMLFAAGTSSALAQSSSDLVWELVDETKTVTDFNTSDYYVIKHGTYSAYNSDAYLSSSGSATTTLDETCVYQFVKDGFMTIEGQNFDAYVLRNVANGYYLSGSNEYSLSRDAASHVVISVNTIPCYRDEATPDEAPDYSSFSLIEQLSVYDATRQPDCEGQCLIFSYVNASGGISYFCYYGNPAYASYKDTQAWRVYQVTSRAKTDEERMHELYSELFANGFEETIFIVGTNPGCISQEVYDKLQAAYERYNEVTGTANPSAEDVSATAAQLAEAAEAYRTGLIMVTPGYYIIRSQRSSDAMYDSGSQGRTTANFATPAEWTESNARYIWEVTGETEINGQTYYNLRNFGTGRYLLGNTTTSGRYPTTATAASTGVNVHRFPYYAGRDFNIVDASGDVAHCDGSAYVVKWNDLTAGGGRWQFEGVSAEAITDLVESIAYGHFLDSLASLVSEAQSAMINYTVDSDVTFDANYASAGIALPANMQTNAPEANEGYAVANQFTQLADGNLQTYFHSSWSANSTTNGGYHYIQMSLEEPAQKIFLKFSDRHNNRNNTPRRIALVAPIEGEDPMDVNATWTDTLMKDTVIYQYNTPFSSGAIDSTTTVMRLDLGKPVTYMRFVVTQSSLPQFRGDGSGPWWNVSELRVYTDGGDNPLYDMIPQDVKDELNRQMEAAEAKLADSTATHADYEALEAALEAFYNAYPDPTELNNRIEDALALLEGAETGDTYGYFRDGVIEQFQQTIQGVQSEIEGQNLTLTQLDEYLQKVNDAIDAFNAGLIMPEDGVYWIRSTSTTETTAGNYVYVPNASENATASWGMGGVDDDVTTRLESMWQLTNQPDGSFTLRNLFSGRYLANLYNGVEDVEEVGLSQSLPVSLETEGNTFTPVFSGTAGSFNLQLAPGYYMNADPSGPVVNWSAMGGNSNFEFVPVDDTFGYSQTVDIRANTVQIISLPFDIMAEDLDVTAFEVAGVLTKDDGNTYVEFMPIAGDIPAATPFVISEEGGISTMMIMLYSEAAEIPSTMVYGYDVKNVNGLVSAITEIVPSRGHGLLLDNMVLISGGDQTVQAGSGYFGSNVYDVTADSEGDLELLISGGEITNIGNVVVVDPAQSSDVYTLSGVKVRTGVSGSEATEGLPTGLYIVGGKKVFVK